MVCNIVSTGMICGLLVLLREALPVTSFAHVSLPGNTVRKEQAEVLVVLQVPQVISQDKHEQEQSYDQEHEKEQAQEKERVVWLSAS